MRFLFSLLYWCFLGSTSAVLFPVALVIRAAAAPFDPTQALLHRFTCWWALLYLRCLPGCRLRVEGRDKIQPHTPYVLVSNHQSMTDIMALSALGVPFKWVSKKETFRIPFIGWNMYLNGYVKVHRGNVSRVRDMMEECRSWLRRAVPVLIFPEGHRSRTGALIDFHSGAFKLAAEAGCAVVPIVVDGTGPIFRGFQVLPCPGRVTIRVLDPVTVAEAGGTATAMRDWVFNRIQQELAALRGQPLLTPGT